MPVAQFHVTLVENGRHFATGDLIVGCLAASWRRPNRHRLRDESLLGNGLAWNRLVGIDKVNVG
jgi:hypothetical protein